ncbi:MAG: aldehyde dehydrogenase [Acidimicrobiaceae bacterium]|nr:aldehyde dehydrogenase [Acidimicrobiaceae bacterium]MYC43445.1 aldehyde dehydrogenase [Acidimicrobiaceae bacterium]MYH87300.1 aldehyde dehydrogenase [Acidimicrobiaceae bacterium]
MSEYQSGLAEGLGGRTTDPTSEPLLADIDGVPVPTGHLIGGEWVGSASTFETRSPLDWDTLHLADVARGDSATAAAAGTAAASGFEVWGHTSVAQRAEILRRLADLIDDNNDEIAHVECLDMGFLKESMRLRLVSRGALNFRTYADLIVAHEDRLWNAKGMTNVVQRMPAGPAVVITPWNAPFMLSTWKLAPALAAGNTVIHKPAEWSPLSAAMLAELALEAGLPAGAYNLVQGIGAEVGAALVADERVRRISFTGSPATGRLIGKAAADNIVPFTAELGGKGPLIVFADADLDAAAHKAAWQFDDSGQVCLAGTRLLVERSIREPFLERFHHHADQLVLGDSRDPTTDIAPLAHPDHRLRVHDFVERSRTAGDTVVRGGRPVDGSLHYEPTLIEPVSNDSEVVQSEVFGPVLTFQTFEDEAEAIQLANSTRYGLAAIVYTGSRGRAERVAAAVRSGLVWVNTFLVRDLTAPFGGCGISGIGREGGDYALDFHSDLKTVMILDDTTS